MLGWLRQLDRLLRGEATKPDEIKGGTLRVPVVGLAFVIAVLGFTYGLCMGVFAITGEDKSRWMQIPASMLKVPALFMLTLIVTMPSLYVFNALVGSRLMWLSVLRLLTAAVAVMLAVLASLGPIVAFFSVSTTSYPFMLLLNVAMFTIAGILGLKFLVQTLHRLTLVIEDEEEWADSKNVAKVTPGVIEAGAIEAGVIEPTVIEPTFTEPPPIPPRPPTGALRLLDHRPPGRNVKAVFRIWLIVFALVGAQMGWVLRPFVGHPDKPFEWFRKRESNFFHAVIKTTGDLMGVNDNKRSGRWAD